MIIPVINDDDHTDQPVEELNPDLSFQWIDGGRILVSRLKSSTPATYDQWEAWMKVILDQWPPERTLCLLLDIRRDPQFTVTLYMGTKLRQFNDHYQHLHIHTAVIYLNQPFSSTVVNTIELLQNPDTQDRAFFTDYDQGIRWLQDKLNTSPSTSVSSDENVGTERMNQECPK